MLKRRKLNIINNCTQYIRSPKKSTVLHNMLYITGNVYVTHFYFLFFFKFYISKRRSCVSRWQQSVVTQ